LGINEKGWTDKTFIAASTKDFEKAAAANKTSLDEAAQITGLTVDQIRHSAEWIAQPKQGGARRRTMFAYEKGLIWGNDNYRTNGALVNVALATGNIGRPGGGCVRMGGHQEGYSRPSDAHVGRPAAYVDTRGGVQGRGIA
jgi:arsenite oxidase large subunit